MGKGKYVIGLGCIAVAGYLLLKGCDEGERGKGVETIQQIAQDVATKVTPKEVKHCPQSEEMLKRIDTNIGRQENTDLYRIGASFTGQRSRPMPQAATLSNASMAILYRELGNDEAARKLEEAIETHIGKDDKGRYRYGTNGTQPLGYQTGNQRTMANLVMAYDLVLQGKKDEARALVEKLPKGDVAGPKNMMYGVVTYALGDTSVLERQVRTIRAVERQTRRSQGGTLDITELSNIGTELAQQAEDISWRAIGMCTMGEYDRGKKHLEKGLREIEQRNGLYLNTMLAMMGRSEAYTASQASVAFAYAKCDCNAQTTSK